MKLGSAIKSLRSKKGFSIEELASKMGLSEEELQTIEDGEKDSLISMNQAEKHEMEGIIDKAATALGVTKEMVLLLCLEQDDLTSDKKIVFSVMEKSIEELIFSTVTTED